MGHEDWDLSAIVRSCKTTKNNNNEEISTNTGFLFPQANTSAAAMPTSLDTLIANQQENEQFSSFPNLMQSSRTNGFQELHQLFVTFNPTTTATTSTSAHGINPNSPPFPDFTARSIEQQQHHHSPLLVPKTNYTSIGASTSGSFDRFQQLQQPQPQPQEQKQHKNQPQVQVPQTSSSSSMALLQNTQSSQTPRSRKRKSLQKKMVCHVTADNLSADLWAWRKYGQKPIKGSPYPRNYYRCSSCKGCGARKQVERSLTDPGMFVITYTGEHRHAKPVHRNSLAGSTRNKTTQPVIPTTRPDPNPESSVVPAAPSHRAPMINNQGGRNDDVEGYADIDAEDSWTRDDRLLTEQEEVESSEDDDDVLIPNDTASAALSDAVFLDPFTLDAEGKNSENTAPG